jgi:predicted HicB family RNase H-like nuclease
VNIEPEKIKHDSPIVVLLTHRMRSRLKQIASEQEISMNALVRQAILKIIKKHEEKC